MEEMLKQLLKEFSEMKLNMATKSNIEEIRSEMRDMKADTQEIRSEMQNMKSTMNRRFDAVETNVALLQKDLADFKNETISSLNSIEQSIARMELSHPEDIHSMLRTINNKLDQRDSDIQVLNRRVFKTESDIEKSLNKISR